MKPILLIFTLLITTLSFHAQDLKLGIPVGHTDIINSAIYSPDGKLVLTSSDDKTARLWDHATGKLIRTFKGHKEAVSKAIFSPDGSKIVTSDDVWSMIWDVGSGRVIDSLNAPGMKNVAFNSDGSRIMTVGSHVVRLWSTSTGELIKILYNNKNQKIRNNSYVYSSHFSPDGKEALVAYRDGSVRLFESSNGELVRVIKKVFNKRRLIIRENRAMFSPDGQLIYTSTVINVPLGHIPSKLSGKWNRNVKVWDRETGVLLNQYNLKMPGNYLEGSGMPKYKEYQKPSSRLFNAWPFFSMNISSDGNYIIGLPKDIEYPVQVFDSKTGLGISSTGGYEDLIYDVALKRYSDTLLTVGEEGVSLWKTSTGDLIKKIEYPPALTVGLENQRYARDLIHRHKPSACFNPEGTFILSHIGNECFIWEIKSGKLLHVLGPRNNTVFTAKLNASNTNVLTVSDDMNARIWDFKKGKVEWSKPEISSASWSPNGQSILTFYTSPKNIQDQYSNSNNYRPKHIPDQYPNWNDYRYSNYYFRYYWNEDKGEYSGRGAYSGVNIYNFDGTLSHSLKGLTEPIKSAIFTPDGQRILTHQWRRNNSEIHSRGFTRDTLSLFDATYGNKLNILGRDKQIPTLQFSPDGKFIMGAKRRNKYPYGYIWDAVTGKRLHEYGLNNRTYTIRSFAFSMQQEAFLVSYVNSGLITLRSLVTSEILFQWSSKYVRHSIDVSADGKQLLATDGESVVVIDISSREVIHEISGLGFGARDILFCPNGKKFLTISKYHKSHLVDMESGEILRDFDFYTSSADNVQFNKDGTILLTAIDGVVELWDVNTGGKILQHFFFDNDPNKWVHLHPSGLFDASPEAMDLMYWTKGLEVIEFSQLKDRYWLPGLWEKVMSGKELPRVKNMQELKLYPEIEVNTIDEHTLSVDLTKRDGGYGAVKVLLNGKEISQDARGANFDPSKDQQTLKIDIKGHPYLKEGENKITVIASSEGGINSRGVEQTIYIDPFEVELPNFYAIVIGVGEYANDRLNLKYATKDAEGIAKALKLGADGLFPNRNSIYALTSNSKLKPSKANIKKVFTEISKSAKSQDVILLYMAGHGLSTSSESGEFYFLTKDAISTSKEAYLDEQIREANTISTNEWVEWLKKIPALKQVMIIDACGSGKAVENLVAMRDIDPSQIRAIDRMKDRTGMYIISGCAADAVSYEASQYGQGLLTFSILQGMKGAALKEGQFIDVENLLNHARESVPLLAEGIGGIQTPQLLKPKSGSFDIGILTEASKSAIPLANPKTVFVRSNFVNSETFEDDLQLSQLLDERLILRSARGSHSDLVYFDVRNFPNACKLSGGYTKSGEQIALTLNIRCGDDLVTHTLIGATVDELCNEVIALVRKSIISNK